MSFIEDVLGPISAIGNETNDDSHSLLSSVLAQIENRPLRSTERRAIQREVMEFMKVAGFKSDNKLSHLFSQRMQYDFLPAISSLGLSSPQELLVPGSFDVIDKDQEQGNHNDGNHNDDISPCLLNDTVLSPFSINSRGKCFVCTVYRTKSALWTTYRLIIDGYKDGCDASVPLLRFPQPLQVLSARKMKSGISSQILMWRSANPKNWRDKSADAHLTRIGQCYIGRVSDEEPINGNRGRGIAISVISKSIDKLIHITAVVSTLTQTQQGAENAVEALPNCADIVANSDDATLLSALHTAVKKEKSSPALYSSDSLSLNLDLTNVTILRSILPRKIHSKTSASAAISSKGREMHALAFSHDCRVKAPSRKNIVIETSTWDGRENGSSWLMTSEPTPNPLFQVFCGYIVSNRSFVSVDGQNHRRFICFGFSFYVHIPGQFLVIVARVVIVTL